MPRTKRKAKTKAWLREHVDDPYVKRAQKEGYRARAVYKLMEIDERDRLLQAGMRVVDLGAAPGSWSQYAVKRLGPGGQLLATDILPMAPLAGVTFIQGDFTEQAVLDALLAELAGKPLDLVISDMAPNISGIGISDQARAIYFAELSLEFAEKALRRGGNLLLKTFQGEGFPAFQAEMRRRFQTLVTRKPKASRPKSREIYLLGKGFLAS